jgi:LacI family transcriptional regulator
MRSTPTVYEVAERAGVSTATVSRVLAGSDRVLPPTRERVLAAVAELGYVPSGAAKDLAARRTRVLGLCFPDLVGDQDIGHGDATYWYDEVIRGLERAARQSGYAVLIAASHESDDVRLVLNMAGRADGLAVLARTVPVGVLEHIAMRIPVVLLAAPRDPDGSVRQLDQLTVANEHGAYQVTAHLADDHAYPSIAFVAGPPESPDSSRRFDGFRRAMTERGLPAPARPEFHGDFTTAGGRRVAAEILAQPALPRALVCANDQTAIGVMGALQHAGLRIPADVAITGFDGIGLGEHLRPSLSTVIQPMRELGALAVSMLQDRIADPSLPPRAVELPVRLQPGGSCGCADPGDQFPNGSRTASESGQASAGGPPGRSEPATGRPVGRATKATRGQHETRHPRSLKCQAAVLVSWRACCGQAVASS